MTATYWIKLYTEILHDPKMGQMSEHLWKRTMETFLLAGEENKDGMLPSLADMAWTLRVDAEQLETDLIELQHLGILVFDNGWIVRKFAERQAPADPTAADRMRRYRERKRALHVTPALRVESESDTESESDKSVTRVTAEQNVQHLLETIVGLPAIPADLPDMDELERMNIQEDDIRGALQWRKENGRGPVKRLSQLFPGIKVEYSKRVQDGNARGNGSKPYVPMTLEEENAAILRKAGLA